MIELCKPYLYTYLICHRNCQVTLRDQSWPKKNNIFSFVMILLIHFGFLLKLKLKLSSLTLLKIDKIIQLITLSKACMENIFQIQLSTYFFKLQDY